MKAYKGTNKDMQCNNYQYEAGKIFIHEEKVEPCSSGFHACTNPIDVLHYYHPSKNSRYFEVDCDGDVQNHNQDSKIACSKITFGAEINLMSLVKAGVGMIFDRVKKDKPDQYTSGDRSTAATSGYQSTAATSGNRSTAATSGNRSTAATSGNRSTAATSGDRSTAATSGDQSTAATSGYQSTAATSGDRSTAATSGYRSTAATSGDRSTVWAYSKDNIAIANGYEAKAGGVKGSYIVLSEYDDDYNLRRVKCAKVDGKKIQENTLYMLKDGKFIDWMDD